MRILIAFAASVLLVGPRGEEVAPGNPLPDLEFRTVLGGDGRSKLSEFRGQPVLIAWYSTVFAGVEGARAAVALEEEFGPSGLVVFLMEIKNNDESYLRALQMAELPGAQCRLLRNQELHVAYDDTTGPPPKLILIDSEGTLLYAGSYQRAGEVKKLLKAELGKLEKGWGADPLRKARALAWGRGELGAARAVLESAGGGTDESTRLVSAIEKRFDALALSVQHHLNQGEPRRAAAAASEAARAAAGNADWVARAKELADLSASAASEMELEKKLDSLLKPTLKGRPKAGLDAKLRAFAEDASGTKVGARAAKLAEAVSKALDGP